MSTYGQYLRRKALLDWYNGLSDEDRALLSAMGKGRSVTDDDGRPFAVDCRDPYWRGVSQNIVGDAIYDAGIHIVRKLFTSFIKR